MPNAKGVPAAVLSSFSYVERRAKPDTTRPVLFAFNGGPGSASIWMHLGFLGPRRVDFPDPVNPPTVAPFGLTDNPHSPLDVADVVMIDPVLTGYSRMLPGARAEEFLGVTADARAIADFIRQWLTRHGRWNSPKYVIGESYGTIRAIALTSALSGGVFPPNGSLGAITLNGIAILGPAFGVGGGRGDGNDRAAMTDLPTMAATAWYHGRLGPKGPPVEAAIDAARAFVARRLPEGAECRLPARPRRTDAHRRAPRRADGRARERLARRQPAARHVGVPGPAAARPGQDGRRLRRPLRAADPAERQRPGGRRSGDGPVHAGLRRRVQPVRVRANSACATPNATCRSPGPT